MKNENPLFGYRDFIDLLIKNSIIKILKTEHFGTASFKDSIRDGFCRARTVLFLADAAYPADDFIPKIGVLGTVVSDVSHIAFPAQLTFDFSG